MEYGGLKMPKDDLGGGGEGVFKFLLSSIPTKQHDAQWVLKDLILIQFYTKSYFV